MHGSLTQNERSAIFKAFKEAKSGVLLTTVSTFSKPIQNNGIQITVKNEHTSKCHRVFGVYHVTVDHSCYCLHSWKNQLPKIRASIFVPTDLYSYLTMKNYHHMLWHTTAYVKSTSQAQAKSISNHFTKKEHMSWKNSKSLSDWRFSFFIFFFFFTHIFITYV